MTTIQPPKNASVYEVITDRITALLEKGVVPWQKSWNSNQQAPKNLISGKPYRGINTLLLHSLGFASPYWLTYKQAQSLGGHVKKSERSCPVIFWNWLEIEKKSTGTTERIPLIRYYSVFNVTQCEGIEIPTNEAIREHSPIAAAEQIVAGMPNRPEVKHGMNRAFYSPLSDTVGMPSPEQFKSSEEYYSVLLHELIHSTGHETRLNRKGVSRTDGELATFGSDPYAREELVAEMGSAFLCGQAGIVERTVENSASYIASWLERLKNDPKLVVQAASQAQKAADWILAKQAVELALAA